MPHRPLSPGELDHAQALFGPAIAYDRVKVHARRYLPFQPRNVAMAPNGHIYSRAPATSRTSRPPSPISLGSCTS